MTILEKQINNNKDKEEWKYCNLKNLQSVINSYNASSESNSLDEYQNIINKYNLPDSIKQIIIYNGQLLDNNNSQINVSKNTVQDLIVLVINTQPEKYNNIALEYTLEENSQLNLIYINTGDNNIKYAQELTQSFALAQNSILNIDYVQEASQQSINLENWEVNLNNKNSQCNINSYLTGAQLFKSNITVNHNAERTECILNGLYLLENNQETYSQLKINHNVPNCISNQYYKGILRDKSISEFTGEINISENSSQIEAYQLNKNMLLSDNAKAYTRPQLQIDNDDVACSHGSTTGQIDAQELLYFQSRGISKQDAQQILIKSFADELKEKAHSQSIKDYLYK